MQQDSAFLTPHPREITNLLEPAILKRLQKEKRGQGVGKYPPVSGLLSPLNNHYV